MFFSRVSESCASLNPPPAGEKKGVPACKGNGGRNQMETDFETLQIGSRPFDSENLPCRVTL